MCIFKRPKVKTPAAAPAQPLPSAEEAEVGKRRNVEDEELYGRGGVPDLRVDRSVNAGGGAGLKGL